MFRWIRVDTMKIADRTVGDTYICNKSATRAQSMFNRNINSCFDREKLSTINSLGVLQKIKEPRRKV